MRALAGVLTVVALLSPPALSAQAPAGSAEPANPELSALVGTWRVDLRPAPDADPYFQSLVVAITDGKVEGSFYDTTFRDFQANADWGPLHFAFVTEDGSGIYHTSGRLVEGRLEGTTHALGRGFLAVWTAESVEDP
jgi:hypothetical protein